MPTLNIPISADDLSTLSRFANAVGSTAAEQAATAIAIAIESRRRDTYRIAMGRPAEPLDDLPRLVVDPSTAVNLAVEVDDARLLFLRSQNGCSTVAERLSVLAAILHAEADEIRAVATQAIDDAATHSYSVPVSVSDAEVLARMGSQQASSCIRGLAQAWRSNLALIAVGDPRTIPTPKLTKVDLGDEFVSLPITVFQREHLILAKVTNASTDADLLPYLSHRLHEIADIGRVPVRPPLMAIQGGD